jgi:CubicO group peptidase (beta-lactamase class C family)
MLCATAAPAPGSAKTPPLPAAAAVVQAAPVPPVTVDSTALVAPESVMIVPTPQAGDEFDQARLGEIDVNPAAFMRAITPLYDGSMIEMHSLLVLARGALIFEDYFVGNTDWIDFDNGLARVPGEQRQWLPGDMHYTASVTKTVTALVAGIAFDEFGWSPEDPLAPRLRSEPWLLSGDKAGITARHILTMTSGVRWNEWNGTSETDAWAAKERFRHFASLPMEAPPGERWTYNSIAPNILLLALDHAVEGGIREYADERFFSRLGIDNYRWGAFEGDIPDGGSRLFLRPRDLAKIGLLILNRGSWRGTQIVPRDYMIAATSPQVSAAPSSEHRYGYLTWIRELAIEDGEPVQYIAVEGDGGNQINIFPDRELIVVTTAGNYGEFPVYEAQAQRLLSRIVPLFAPHEEARPPVDSAPAGF